MSVANVDKALLGSDPSMVDSGSRTEEILSTALDVVANDGVPASVAVSSALSRLNATDDERVRVQGLFGEALVSVDIGNGRDFHRALLERALALAGGSSSKRTRNRSGDIIRKEKKMDNENNVAATTATSNDKGSKKYKVGDVFNLVAEMGLQPSGNGADVPYKLSRKTGKDGGRTLAQGTPLTYVGARAVFKDKPSSKRMIFRLEDGTEVAGVVNHIDPDDPYNKKDAKGIDMGTASTETLEENEVAAA